MKKKQIALNQKLFLKKNIITDLKGLAQTKGGGDPPYQSLQCPSMNCTAAVCDPNGSVNCQSVFQCPSDTIPGVNKCVLVEQPTFGVACPPVPVTTNCTFALYGCAISK